MDKWVGKVAIVTGASCGIGKDVAMRLVNYGLNVVGCGRNFDNLLKVNGEIPKDSKGKFIPFRCDVSNEEDVLKMFDYVKTNFKELSIMINNAGFALEGPILGGKTENWRSMFDTNVLGLCVCTREAFSLMKENENSKDINHIVPGHIININSIAGHRVPPRTFSHFYSCTKIAVTAITEAIRQELREAKSNIRVTQISPGFVDTEFATRSSGELFARQLKTVIPEPLQASDITDAIVFTLSAESRNAIHDILIRPITQEF